MGARVPLKKKRLPNLDIPKKGSTTAASKSEVLFIDRS
jgi:hypothetical protein